MVRTCVSARSAEKSVCGAVAGTASGAFSSAMASTASRTMKHKAIKDENNEEVDEVGDCVSAIRNQPAFGRTGLYKVRHLLSNQVMLKCKSLLASCCLHSRFVCNAGFRLLSGG